MLRNRKLYPVFFIIWAVIVFVVSVVSMDSFDEIPGINIPYFDKFVHFAMYFLFAYLLYPVLKFCVKIHIIVRFAFIFTLIFSVFYGGMIEILQGYLVLTRDMDIFDFIANCMGALTGMIVFLFFNRY